MGDVVTTFTGDDKQIEKVYEKLKRLDLELIERQRKLHAQTKEGADAFQKWGQEQANFVKGLPAMALGFLGVEKAVNAITDAIASWKSHFADAANKSREFSRDLAKSAGLTSDSLQLDRIKAAFEEQAAKRTADLPTSAQLFEGIRSGGPSLTLERRLGIYQHAAKLSPLGDVSGLGRRAGILGEWGGMKDEQAVGVAQKLLELGGSEAGADALTSDEVLRAIDALQRSGAVGSREEGFGIGVQLNRAKLSPRVLERMNAAIVGHHPFRRPEAGKPFSQLDAAWNRFAGTNGAAQRLRMLQTDPLAAEAMLGEKAAQLGGINWGAVAGSSQAIRDAESPGYLDRFAQAGKGTRVGFEASREMAFKARSDEGMERIYREHGMAGINAKFVEQLIDTMSPEEKFRQRNPMMRLVNSPELLLRGDDVEQRLGAFLSPKQRADYDSTTAPFRGGDQVLGVLKEISAKLSPAPPPPVLNTHSERR